MSAAGKLKALDEAMTTKGWYWWMSEEPPWEIGREGRVHLGISVRTGISDASGICELRNALPQIVSVMEAAEVLTNDWPSEVHGEITGEAFGPLDAALTALDEALQ
jgi:hypothetical protein